MQEKYVFVKWERKTGRTIGYLSKNKKRWSMRSCGIFHSTDFVEWNKKNSTDEKYGYSAICIYNS